MAGSFDFEPRDVPLSSPAAMIRVCRYHPARVGAGRFEVLPNVVCERIRYREGPEPPAARFRYVLDGTEGASGAPSDFGGLWPLDAAGPHVVRDDDRLVVLAVTPSGELRVLFDGFARSPRVDVTPRSQRVGFLAVGAAVRCWDEPIGGRWQRHADDPFHGEVAAVDLPTRFNPDGKPNCAPDGFDVERGNASIQFPVFLDPDLDRDPDPRSYWTLGKFVRHILGVYNDQEYVKNPDFDRIDALLRSRTPAPGSAFIDSNEATAADVVIRDFDASNLPWPEALAAQLGLAGFGMRFVTGEDGDGSPRNEIEIYRKDAEGGAARDLLLSEVGSELNPARCNVGGLRLQRDSRAIVNAVTVETSQRRTEVSIVLAPGFEPVPGDEAAEARARYLRANLTTATDEARRKYRFYVANEAGDGHWDYRSAAWSNSALDLSPVFPSRRDGKPSYVKRLRPGSSRLVTRDANGRPLRAELAFSRDYSGAAPAVWDGSGNWQPISGGWELLEDRLGIFIVVEDPEAWPIGEYTGDTPQEPSRTLRGITSQANPAAPNGRFFLRLTTVIDDDSMISAAVDARPASPTSHARRRRVDARDHFGLEVVSARSTHNPTSTPRIVRDDSSRALTWARQLQAAHELPPLTGGATIPGLVTAYRVGDRVARINGRDIGLQTNLGAGQGEAPVYPAISALTWDFTADRQVTILELADANGG